MEWRIPQLACASLLDTNEKVLFVFEPTAVMAAIQTTTIRANMTAYSTAVGPSSFCRNETNSLVKRRISIVLMGRRTGNPAGRMASRYLYLAHPTMRCCERTGSCDGLSGGRKNSQGES